MTEIGSTRVIKRLSEYNKYRVEIYVETIFLWFSIKRWVTVRIFTESDKAVVFLRFWNSTRGG